MPRTLGARDHTPDLRGGLKRYLLIQQEEGRAVSDIWAELFERDSMAAMRLAIQLQPKATIELDLPEFQKVSEVVPDVVKAIAGGQVSPEDGAALVTALQRGAQLEKLDALEEKVNRILEGQGGNA